ncbi:hypothetical protein [Ascidiaceihabitans sp.]|uniref:hypothetical protein n=1 Tax=Ascidiaceihabitans sp. TaxID=1872644 RepID=UPI003298C4E6
MKTSILSAIGVFCFSSVSHAGCYNWEDHNYKNPEHHLICFKNKCDITRIDYICSTINSVNRGFEAGWQIVETLEPYEQYASWNGSRIPSDQHKHLRCFEFEDETLMQVIGSGNCWSPKD